MRINNFLFLLVFAPATMLFTQTLQINGNVSTSTECVKNALITFIDVNDTTKKYSTLTDNYGNYNIGLITSIVNNTSTLPAKFELAQNYPNPFTTETTITYKLNELSDVSAKIYNVLGQEVKRITIGTNSAGVHSFKWNGKDNSGNKLSVGIYFYQLQCGTQRLIKKMIYGIGQSVGEQFNLTISNFEGNTANNLTKNSFTKRTYIVKINNTLNTKPIIEEKEFQNITIEHDTTLDFNVNEGAQWKLLGLEDESVTAIAVDPINSNIIYVGTLYDYSAGKSGKLFKSMNSGSTWDTLVVGGGYRNILIDPTNTNILYATPGTIIKSTDSGKTWQPIIEGISINLEKRVQCITMNPKNSNVLYAGTGGFYGGTLFKSCDSGLHWNKIPSDSLNDGVTCIAVDPVDTNNVYAGTAFRGILWKSTNAGMSWFRTGSGEIGVYHILINSKTPNKIFIGVSNSGIFRSDDGGLNWKNFSQGLTSNSSVMKIQESNNSRLFLIESSTNGSGIYEYLFQKNEWEKIGIISMDNQYYYYSDLKVTTNPQRLYFGGKGVYVMDLKE